RHPWASRVIETRAEPTPALMVYMDEMVGAFLAGGFSIDLTHHAMHAMGSRILGFSQELFDDSTAMDPQVRALMLESLAAFPHITELLKAITHQPETVVGAGCDDQFEFEFALDLMLDGLERLQAMTPQETGAS